MGVTQKFWLYTPIFLIFILLVVIFFIDNLPDYDAQTARYTYSAIFQGFAAILAISITAVLISLHQISNTIDRKEERIYKILGKRVPDHIPGPIIQERFFTSTTAFIFELEKSLRKQVTNSRDIRPLARLIRNEVRSLFRDIWIHRINHSSIRDSFESSLPLTIIIMIISLIALVYATPVTNSNQIVFYDVVIDSQKVLYIVFVSTFYAILGLAFFFYNIIHEWNAR